MRGEAHREAGRFRGRPVRRPRARRPHRSRHPGVHDLPEAESFIEWTWANAGKELPFEFIPADKHDKAVRGRVTIERSDIGGEVGVKLIADLEFTCTTMPTIEPKTKIGH